ncbi:hypothetical protein PN480_03305 [Dolichospermum circinale CS-1225]|uniref:hypothetical protein n=1 Tax=Dolichospermum circinale TaxID=109265 RepID=UPI00233135DA|nr:hypothetical protein [Dolichospermum circinale]MDB9520983.1 hypothetical protein [Dolichospermum circinale CS-1225]
MNYIIYNLGIGYLCDYQKSTEKGLRASVIFSSSRKAKLLTWEVAMNWVKLLETYRKGKFVIIDKREIAIEKREMYKAP